MRKHTATFKRIQSKILRVRRLALEWIRRSGDAGDLMPAFIRLNRLLRRKRLRSVEQELDLLLERLQRQPGVQGERRSAA